jgi:predicted glycogen debranching enzyme
VRAAGRFVVGDTQQTLCVMSGYHWGAASGRDSLICLPGLLLVTGRLADAKTMLRFFASHAQNGLIPSEIPADGSALRFESADASLWFINALCEYLRYGGEEDFVLHTLWPVVDEILRHYQQGTGLGIAIDSEGLLASHQAGVATSWMDARIGDWVITPRQGKTVELNALWHNALCIGAELARLAGDGVRGDQLTALAAKVKTAFNLRFWNEFTRCCYDAIDSEGPDVSIRPNQVLALSLPYPVLSFDRHAAVLKALRELLLTPFGLRTLSPDHPQYTPHYGGAIISRDKALHQGSVYPWLLGPYVTSLVRAFGRSPAVRQEAGKLLAGCLAYIKGEDKRQLCEGQLCELFDGADPHAPGGLIASARSVAEILRCYVEDVLDLLPQKPPFARGSGPPAQIFPLRVVYPT